MKNDGKRIKIKSDIAKDAGTTLNKKQEPCYLFSLSPLFISQSPPFLRKIWSVICSIEDLPYRFCAFLCVVVQTYRYAEIMYHILQRNRKKGSRLYHPYDRLYEH